VSRLARIGVGVLQVLAFFVITGLLAQAYTRYDAKTFAAGQAPPGYFPVLAMLPGDAKPRLLRWSEIENSRLANPALTFRLEQPKGRFTLPHEGGGIEPTVEYTAVATEGGRQRIEVTSMDDDYTFHSRYATDGASVQAEYLRTSGGIAAMVAMIPGLLLTWLLSRLLAGAWRRRKGVDALQP